VGGVTRLRFALIRTCFNRLGRHLEAVQASDRGRQFQTGPKLNPDLPPPLALAVHRPESHLQQAAGRSSKDCHRNKYCRFQCQNSTLMEST